MNPLLILSIISASLMTGSIVTFILSHKELKQTVKRQDEMISTMCRDEQRLLEAVRKAEFKHNIEIWS
jgi:hypothetical protein